MNRVKIGFSLAATLNGNTPGPLQFTDELGHTRPAHGIARRAPSGLRLGEQRGLRYAGPPGRATRARRLQTSPTSLRGQGAGGERAATAAVGRLAHLRARGIAGRTTVEQHM